MIWPILQMKQPTGARFGHGWHPPCGHHAAAHDLVPGDVFADVAKGSDLGTSVQAASGYRLSFRMACQAQIAANDESARGSNAAQRRHRSRRRVLGRRAPGCQAGVWLTPQGTVPQRAPARTKPPPAVCASARALGSVKPGSRFAKCHFYPNAIVQTNGLGYLTGIASASFDLQPMVTGGGFRRLAIPQWR